MKSEEYDKIIPLPAALIALIGIVRRATQIVRYAHTPKKDVSGDCEVGPELVVCVIVNTDSEVLLLVGVVEQKGVQPAH